mmetsp:Transcript_4965/g.14225  ORF Transcript_4965/g.14225 Transcript_4965/m.14225 type:complete len:85 (+) Transcript_4965:3479-3733(+)
MKVQFFRKPSSDMKPEKYAFLKSSLQGFKNLDLPLLPNFSPEQEFVSPEQIILIRRKKCTSLTMKKRIARGSISTHKSLHIAKT